MKHTLQRLALAFLAATTLTASAGFWETVCCCCCPIGEEDSQTVPLNQQPRRQAPPPIDHTGGLSQHTLPPYPGYPPYGWGDQT